MAYKYFITLSPREIDTVHNPVSSNTVTSTVIIYYYIVYMLKYMCGNYLIPSNKNIVLAIS